MSQRPFPSSCRLLLLLCIALPLSGCSSFNSRWAAIQEQGVAADVGVQGRWAGRWHSVPTGHAGALRCIVTPAEDGVAENYHFAFSATWGPGIVSEYNIPMKITAHADGRSTFAGEMNLGPFMGVFRCQGHIDRERLFATYTANIDHGSFEMTRPGETTGTLR